MKLMKYKETDLRPKTTSWTQKTKIKEEMKIIKIIPTKRQKLKYFY